ncbi:MAG: LysR family transcriptional regulator, partial [Deltaproteobacteria bacterium]|nr:LysR family transcriptional regulator [Deltaproteobacteria bacterium]
MEIIDLRIFIAIAETGSATKAAERMNMTQPGVSQHLAKLEEHLGSRLFDRIGKHLELSNFGRSFLERSRKLLSDVSQLEIFATGESCPIDTLRLGLTDSATMTFIPDALMKFRRLYPGAHIRIDVNDSIEIEHGLLRGHYDIGVVTASKKAHPMLKETLLFKDHLDVIVGHGHPLSKKKLVSLEELTHTTLILYPRKRRTRLMIDDVFHKKKLYPKEIIDVYFSTAAIKLAEKGMGATFLSREFITENIRTKALSHLKIIGEPFRRNTCLALKRDSHLTESAR